MISIHAPPRGATVDPDDALDVVEAFQFTPLREGRHADDPRYTTITRFQFTPLREGRPAVLRVVFLFFVFQFTPLREGRLPFCVLFSCFLYFNSRPSARGDSPRIRGNGFRLISIHAPPRGATGIAMRRGKKFQFQFTPLREGRQQKICNFCKSFVQPLQISMA